MTIDLTASWTWLQLVDLFHLLKLYNKNTVNCLWMRQKCEHIHRQSGVWNVWGCSWIFISSWWPNELMYYQGILKIPELVCLFWIPCCVFASFLSGTSHVRLRTRNKDSGVGVWWSGLPQLESLQQCEAASCPRHSIVVSWPAWQFPVFTAVSHAAAQHISHSIAERLSSVWLHEPHQEDEATLFAGAVNQAETHLSYLKQIQDRISK